MPIAYNERVRRLFVIAIVLVGCRGGSSPSKNGAGSAGSAAPRDEGPHVELKIDGGAARTLTVTGTTPLATLVPPTPPWLLVEAAAADGRYLELQSPATTYPGAEIRLYLRDERPVIGVFRAAVTGVPAAVAEQAAQPVVELTAVTSIDVWTHPPPSPAAEATLAIEIAGKPRRDVPVSDLAQIAEQHDRRMRGWLLRDILADSGARDAIASVKVVGASGEHTVTPAELAGLALLKKNQRGELVFQVWQAGGDQALLQVRGVTRLVVEPAR